MRPDDNGRNFLRAKAILTSPIPASAVLVAFWLACTCCNLFKPFHIDDTAHLEIARWIAAHPLHPMSGILNWDGITDPIHRTNQPALYFYLLALWGSVFGYSEPAMHISRGNTALTKRQPSLAVLRQ